ncbi:MAG: chromosome segregation protein SMC [Halanaerobiales bacterium]
MFLKKIKIKGFKSFANTINLKFDTPITAIVGPNGSGKSNIVDAVRWVLGEQSAKNLRGTEMADVIFSGSEKLPPASSAEVSLFLDNSGRILDIETDEVKISREVSQDGESDYLINDSKCRLKDVNELLMDTGLGKNSYSIVSQGKITQIINSKPENLRELFEEAAGISKHKSRKQDAEKRLEKTNSNLQRIKDLVWELEKQFNKLEKEAEKAREYKDLRTELKDIEINLLLDQHHEFSIRLNQLLGEKTELEDIIEQKEKIVSNKKGKLHNKKEKLRELEVRYDDKKDEYYRLKTKNEEVKNRLNIIEERKNNLNREKNKLEQELTDLKEELVDKNEKLTNLKDSLDNESTKLDLWAEKKAGVEKDHKTRLEHLKKLRNELNEYRENLIEENVDINQLRRDYDKLEEKIKYKERVLSDLKDQKEQTLTNQAQVENKIANNKKMQNETSKELEVNKQKLTKIEKQVKDYQDRYQELEAKYEKIQAELYQKKARKEFIEDLKKKYSGFYKGVKNILKAGDRFPDMYGAVAELIDVEKEYETALDTTLGNKLQNIVVKDDKTAKNCIDYLKHNSSGRATFLPIESIKSYRKIKTASFKDNDGYLGLAIDFVDFDEKYIKIMKYLMGNTIITTDLNSAIEISNVINKKYKIVTKEGDLIFPGGSLSGGSRENKKNNILNREREISELNSKIDDLKEEIDEVVKEGLEIKDHIEEYKAEKETLSNNYQELKLRLKNYKNNEKELKKQLNEIKEKEEKVDNKITQVNKKLKSLKEEKSNLSGLFEKNSQNYEEEKDIINSKQQKINNLNDEIEEMRENLTEIRVKFATQQEKIKSIKNNIDNLENSIEQNKYDQDNKSERIKNIREELEELSDKKVDLKDQKAQIENNVKTAEKDVERYEVDLKQIRKEYEQLETEVEYLNEELNEKKDYLHEINLEYTRKNDKTENIEERLYNEYNFDLEEDKYEKRESVKDPETIEKRVHQLRDKISKLGSVNLGAIEEYEELKERLDYLHEQQDDLEEAKESILNIINRIEETMMEKFKATFYQIKEEFEDVFVELFKGGRAELNLVDENELLETGVDIIAQPPGKKLKKLTLLSGGERALTAIALVFALLRVNPSPFYILDEIDAPLDDVNVVRFSNFLKEYIDFAQFVVVTHRKHMMTAVDNIYGLTMTDKGVTELVSLNIKEQLQ